MKTPGVDAVRILVGDVLDGLRTLPDCSVHCAVTSPPYWGLRDYGVEGQIGLERTPDEFVQKMVEVFREVRRVLRDDGTLWLNIGDSYNAGTSSGRKPSENANHGYWENGGTMGDRRVKHPTLKTKDLCMMPWRVAMALQADGWWLRSVIVWAKKSPMPESVTDRPTSSWEPIFLLAKSERYFYDAEAVKESAETKTVRDGFRGGDGTRYTNGRSFDNDADAGGGSVAGTGTRNQRNVWHLGPEPYKEAHFATFPSEIPKRAIMAGTSEKGCCPACGAGWVMVVERTSMVIAPSGRDGRIEGNGQRSTSGTMVEPPSSRTTGWRPGCGCAAGDPVPCVVLDPFLGSGTTIAVARQLGRYGVGCELNPAYAELARVRIGKAEKPATFVDPRVNDSPLFAP